MLIELILALVVGITIGTITGLTPGIHTNLVSIIVISFIPLFPYVQPITFIVFIVSMSITNSFIDFIPSVFLGAPNEDTVLVTLPGHQLLIEGRGHWAVMLTLIGSSLAIVLLIPTIPLFILIIPKIYPFIQRMMGFFLILICLFLIFYEKQSKIRAFLIFILAGFLGFIILNSNINQPLLPLLTGLFGSSTLIYSIKSKTIIPKQTIEKISFSKNKKELIKPTLSTLLVSPICSFLPGLGTSQAAIIGSELIKQKTKEQFLILVGSINTLIMSLSFVVLFLINKSRTGAANAISQITILTTSDLIIILITVVISAALSIPLTIILSKTFAKNIHKINYTKLSYFVLLILTTVVITFSGMHGLISFIIATIIGLTCLELRVRMGFLMGCLLIPTILFYLPF